MSLKWKSSFFARPFFIGTILLGILLSAVWQTNLTALETKRICVEDKNQPILPIWLNWLEPSSDDSRNAWFKALQARCMMEPDVEEIAWFERLSRTDQRIEIIRLYQTDNVELASAATKTYPKNPIAWFWIADIYAEQENYEDSILAYQAGLEMEPTNGSRWMKLGRQYELVGDLNRALQAYDNACTWVDDGKNGCPNAARLYGQFGMYKQAAQRWRVSLRQLPGYPKGMLGLAQTLIQLGRGEEARPYLEKLAKQGNQEAQRLLSALDQNTP